MTDMNYMKKVTFSMPAHVHSYLKAYCARQGEPMGEWIMWQVMAAVKAHLEAENNGK